MTQADILQAIAKARLELVGASVKRYIELMFAIDLLQQDLIKLLEAGR
jgi:hypothetical protein